MKLLFSDLDGTLEDSRRDMAEAAVRVRRSLGLPPRHWEELSSLVNRGMEELYRNCFADYLAAAPTETESHRRLATVREAYDADYLANIVNHTKLYPGMGATLARVAEHARIVVVTNKPTRHSWALLEKLGVAGFISEIMGGDSCAETKPSPLPLRIAAGKLGFSESDKSRFAMMGDSAADVLAGKAFGARTLWCRWGYVTSLPEELKADVILERAEDLLEHIVRS